MSRTYYTESVRRGRERDGAVGTSPEHRIGGEADQPDMGGYVRLDRSGTIWPPERGCSAEQERAEARMEVDDVWKRLTGVEKAFLEPFRRGSVEDLKSLGRWWGIGPSAVTKRLDKIRRRLTGKGR